MAKINGEKLAFSIAMAFLGAGILCFLAAIASLIFEFPLFSIPIILFIAVVVVIYKSPLTDKILD